MTKFPGEASTPAEELLKYTRGGTNAPYIDQSTSETTGRVGGYPLYGNVNQQILSEMKAAAKKMGQNPIFFEQVFDRFNNEFWKDADRDILRYEMLIPDRRFREANIVAENSDEYETNPQSFEKLLGYARWWYSSKIPGLSSAWGGASSSGSGRRGGGGGGGPTAQDIRNQFDIDQLSTRTDDLFRAYLLDEADDPRNIAKAFVDKMVASRGELKLDFDTFVLSQYIKPTARYASIYKNKPASMSETDYIGQYVNQASAVLRPDDVADVAVGGAQFGASAEQFEQRLQRSNEFRTSSSFLQGLEGRMRSIKGVLKG